MKITITNYGDTHSFECDHDDVTLDKVIENFRGLLVAAGYHPASVDTHFNSECEWNLNDIDNKNGSYEDEDPVGSTRHQLKYPEDFPNKHDKTITNLVDPEEHYLQQEEEYID